MTITTTVLVDDAEKTTTQVIDSVLGTKTLQTVYKAGTPQFNVQALQTAAVSAIATLNTAESILVAGGSAWDTATPAQRTTLMLGLTRDVRALIRLLLGILDQPS